MDNLGPLPTRAGTLVLMASSTGNADSHPAASPRRPRGPFLGWPAFVQRPFAYGDGIRAGIPARTLQSAEFRQLLWGVYVHSRVRVDGLVEARAIECALPDEAFASHLTAARVWGAVVPHSSSWHASIPTDRARSSRANLVVHASDRQPVVFRGLRVTSAVDTFLDCSRLLDLVDLVILGDSLVKKGRTNPAALVAACGQTGGRGVRLAREAAALVRAGVDSPMETRARLLRVLSGLPELDTDIRFHGEHGTLLRRLDAGDRKSRTAVEYDGRHHVERQQNWEADIGRREEFEDEEWRIVTLVSKDIFITPGRTIARLRRIFRKRGIPVGPGRDDWHRHFPDRE